MNISQQTIVQKVIDKKNQVRGYLAASFVPNHNVVCFGWSLRRKSDVLDKTLGMRIAIDRSLNYECAPVPFTLQDPMFYMINRARKYFKAQPIREPIYKNFITPKSYDRE